jgi:heme-degrading monooxygenase HmoA
VESLALLAVVVLFTSLIGGPVAFLLTYIPDQPKKIRIFRTIAVAVLSLLGLLFGFQLVIASGVPFAPKLIGIIGVTSSIIALLYEFKVLTHKNSKFVSGASNSELDNSNSISGNEISIKSDGTFSASASAENKLYAVIFKSKRQDANSELYYQHNDPLDEKIKTIPGYVKHSGIRHPETREGVTVAYFDSLDAINKWRKDSEHMDAKKLAKSHFYENYSVEITEVIDSYGWDEESR